MFQGKSLLKYQIAKGSLQIDLILGRFVESFLTPRWEEVGPMIRTAKNNYCVVHNPFNNNLSSKVVLFALLLAQTIGLYYEVLTQLPQ